MDRTCASRKGSGRPYLECRSCCRMALRRRPIAGRTGQSLARRGIPHLHPARGACESQRRESMNNPPGSASLSVKPFMKTALLAALSFGLLGSSAFAGPHFGLYVNFGGYGCAPRCYAPPVCYAPAPTYYCAPRVVYYQPAPVCYAPAPVVYAPVCRAPIVAAPCGYAFGWRR